MPQFNLEQFYKPQPKQVAFHTNPARYRLQVGGAGSGKSIGMLWEAIRWCYLYPGIQCLLLRRNFPELQKGLISDLHSTVPKELFRWNDSKHIATFPVPGLHNSTIHFGHLEGNSESALAQYLSSAFPLIGIDEIGQFTFKHWEFLTFRNRLNPGCTGNPTPGMMGATNPTGPGWGWIKSLWVDHKMPPECKMGAGHVFTPTDYWYIHSTVLDNNALLDRNPSYLLNLKNLSEPMRQKFLYGNLDTVSGQYFLPFDHETHVLPASAFEWQPWERVWMGLDWGLAHNTAILWFTRAIHRTLKKSVTVCYRERIFNETSLEDAASIIKTAMKDGSPVGSGYGSERKALTSIFASHELFQRRTAPQSAQTVAAEFSRALHRYGLPGIARAAGSANREERVRGAVMLYEDLANRDFFILDTCPRLAESVPSLIRSEKDSEDVQKSDTVADDVFDALKHGILSVSLPRPEPPEAKVQREAAEITDPMARWFFLTKKRLQKESAPFWTTRIQRR